LTTLIQLCTITPIYDFCKHKSISNISACQEVAGVYVLPRNCSRAGLFLYNSSKTYFLSMSPDSLHHAPISTPANTSTQQESSRESPIYINCYFELTSASGEVMTDSQGKPLNGSVHQAHRYADIRHWTYPHIFYSKFLPGIRDGSIQLCDFGEWRETVEEWEKKAEGREPGSHLDRIIPGPGTSMI
jgi:hypothetical protein